MNKQKIKHIVVHCLRIVLALTFMFSGYVKAVDPTGTMYKMKEYLVAMNAADLLSNNIIIIIAALLAVFEFMIGALLFINILRKITRIIALGVMIGMTILTMWLYFSNPISDCGCFGDAVVITNLQTLIKNIILLIIAFLLVVYRSDNSCICFNAKRWAMYYTLLYIVGTLVWSMYYLPVLDFLPYKEGVNIIKGMEMPQGAEMPEFETTFILEKNGKRQEFTLENYPDSTWTFIDSKTIKTKEGYVPPIHDFSITTFDGEDITERVLKDKDYSFLMIAPHFENADNNEFGEYNQLYKYAQENGYSFYCLTASSEKAVEKWVYETGSQYQFCRTDETTLKTIIRSNPGLILIKDAQIIKKWGNNNMPTNEIKNKKLEVTEYKQCTAMTLAEKAIIVIVSLFVPLLIILFVGYRCKNKKVPSP